MSAGRTFRFMRIAGPRIVRTMPNTPAAIGRGITSMVPNMAASEDGAHAKG
jgi:pyrroline-5-carboxylate reductase